MFNTDPNQSLMFAGQDPNGDEGTPGGPVMAPQWKQFFSMLNAIAKGGIGSKMGMPGQTDTPFAPPASLKDTGATLADPSLEPTSTKYDPRKAVMAKNPKLTLPPSLGAI